MTSAVTLVDSLIVIGGGLTGARRWFMPALLKEMRSQMRQTDGTLIDRLPMKVYDLDDEAEFTAFARGEMRLLPVYGSAHTVAYDPQKRIGVTISKLGASKAISVGAYAFALSMLDKDENR